MVMLELLIIWLICRYWLTLLTASLTVQRKIKWQLCSKQFCWMSGRISTITGNDEWALVRTLKCDCTSSFCFSQSRLSRVVHSVVQASCLSEWISGDQEIMEERGLWSFPCAGFLCYHSGISRGVESDCGQSDDSGSSHI